MKIRKFPSHLCGRDLSISSSLLLNSMQFKCVRIVSIIINFVNLYIFTNMQALIISHMVEKVYPCTNVLYKLSFEAVLCFANHSKIAS